MAIFLETAAGIFILYSVIGWTLYFRQPRLLYKPVRKVSYYPSDVELFYEEITFKAADETELNGWFVPCVDGRFTVLFCHGNAGNIMHQLDSIDLFNRLGLNVFIFDYRGYGKSKGKPSEEGTYLDAQAAYRWLCEDKGILPEDIIIFGRSLGGSVASRLASEVSAGGLVIESSFTSYAAIGQRRYPYLPVKFFARFKYRTIDYVREVACPVLVIHSRSDEFVPFESGRKIFEAACGPKHLLEINGSHNDGFLTSGDIYEKGIEKWVSYLEEKVSSEVRDKAG